MLNDNENEKCGKGQKKINMLISYKKQWVLMVKCIFIELKGVYNE